uniref:1-phosphatidylinositol 4,5-bisphosphate phosphodiesterase n=1 Tax=Phallusia mammillata TaxID=59560 RepID=A0A6F9DPK6_9ASCI|nr:1-phosphatidylinositol 4,5-bisphosphate phosphodiesterase beta-4 [Phallusia mammillata]
MEIPAFIEKGEEFLKRAEGTAVSQNVQKCLLRMDDDGLFVIWQFGNRPEIYCLETSQIHEVKTGIPLKDAKAVFEQHDAETNVPNKVLTFYHGFEIGNLSIIQFVATSTKSAQKWEESMSKLVLHIRLKHLSPAEIMKKQWKRLQYSLNQKGMIPIRKLVKQFGHDKSEKAILQKFNHCGFNCSKKDEINPAELTFQVYKKLHQKVCERPDLQSIFQQIGKKKQDYISLSDFIAWLNENQRDPRLNEILDPTYDEKRAGALIQKYENCPKNVELNRLSLQGFTDYMSSVDNPLIYPSHLQQYQDMDQPLSHYFISSSHNTYLTGRQFGGKSSVDIYRHVLLSGCRCVELDCWDGKGDYHGEPIITHGKAMCSDVPFKNILYAIKDSAFVVSEYPVVLSFETHCSKPLQLKMAKYCEEVFGEMLLTKPLESFPLERGIPLPPPSALKRRILIKNKRLDPETEKVQLDEMPVNEEHSLPEPDFMGTEEAHPELRQTKSHDINSILPKTQEPKPTVLSTGDIPTKTQVSVTKSLNVDSTRTKSKKQVFTEEDESELLRNYEYTKPSATNIHPYLSSIVNYCQSVKFPGFKKLEEDNNRMCFQMSSFSESMGLNYVKTNATELVNFNKNQLSRIYPRGNRVDSSNYMPQIFWNVGCQMVSLNFQTCDLAQQLNAAKFEYNASAGYLLKPEMLLKENRFFDPFAESTVDGVIAAQCTVKVISAQFVSDKPVSTYVEVDMYGLPNDTIRKEFRTQLVVGNALNPQYNGTFLFRKIIFPDLALMRFTLYDDSRQLIGQRVIPLSSLQNGYRYVSLRTTSGVPLDSASIFVKFQLRSYVPDSLMVIANALENPKAHQISLRKQHEEQLKRLEDDGDDSDSEQDSSNGDDRSSVRQTKSSDSSTGGESTTKNNPKVKLEKNFGKTASEKQLTTAEIKEENSINLKMLLDHPVYVKAAEVRRKEAAKSIKRQEKLQSKALKREKSIKKKNDDDTQTCFPLGKILGKRSKNGSPSNSEGSDRSTEEKSDVISSLTLSDKEKKEALRVALETVQQQNLADAEETHKKEMAELIQNQTKQWMEKSKVIRKDKTIASGERDRRLKDQKHEEVKKYLDERQTLKIRQMKSIERLRSVQSDEADRVKQEIEEAVV